MTKAILILFAGVALGYSFGYRDFKRGDRAVGARVGRMVNRVHPDQVRRDSIAEAKLRAKRDSVIGRP
jgi:hypothetical protein